MGHAALALEAETESLARHAGVAPLERGQAVGLVGPGILARADAHQGRLQQAYQYGYHLFLG
ncbi:hypothetical protein D3C77_675000 [compost metagenome]